MSQNKRDRQPSRSRSLVLLAGLVALIIIFSSTVVHLLTEAWWFEAVGFSQVFWTLLLWRSLVWVGTFAIFTLFLGANYAFAMRVTRYSTISFLEGSQLQNYSRHLPRFLMPVGIVIVALTVAGVSVEAWEPILKYLNATPFERNDPIYGRDLGFYVFQLPFYEGLREWLMALLVSALIVAIAVYALKGTINPRRGWQNLIYGEAKAHVSLLLCGIAFLLAIGFWLERYDLLYGNGGIVAGAGYTDTHARLTALTLMSLVAVALAVLLIATAGRSSLTLPLAGIGVYAIALIILYYAFPWLQQQLLVEPNELEKERPYIEYSINLTRQAYGLDSVQREFFPARAQLDRQDIDANQGTIRNIRLWDYRPLLTTYSQLQEIRPYYNFLDVDLDRYTLDGDYRQVMLSARELSESPRDTWVSQRLKYTHGYGLVMSSVNQVTSEGLPELFVKNIPPVASVDLEIDEPRIYYGEQTDRYIFTGMGTPEFDYPLGAENAQTMYAGQGGVPIGSWWRRLVYAYDLGSLKALISPYFTPDSRIHYHRPIVERIAQVAPFLRLDGDPYLTVVDGRLQWIVEGYTVSDRYPYSQSASNINNATTILQPGSDRLLLSGGFNYARNSVKIAIDAYDGTMQFFVIDESDPILASYRKIFPQLFAPSEAVPESLRAHFRYPLDLFKIQTQMFLSYHMSDPEVFYNQEDLWRFPSENYEGNQQLVEPYYIIMRLPQAQSEEFVLILPFTPIQRDNMIAWMAARSDGENYGRLLLYEFPKQELVYGPSQIEARINQNPEISEQLSLWDQEGSRVIRGNLLVIPIEDSLLYVEPIYLRAEQGELPQLRRVVVSSAQQVVMRPTLEQAIAAVFGEAEPAVTTETPTGTVPSDLAEQAQATLRQAQAAARAGNWAEYGRLIERLDAILEQLNR